MQPISLCINLSAENNGTNNSRNKRAKKIGAHSCYIPHIIAHIIYYGSRVSSVIFRNTGFSLINQLRSDGGSVGEDSASHTGNKCNTFRTEGEAGKCFLRLDQLLTGIKKAKKMWRH